MSLLTLPPNPSGIQVLQAEDARLLEKERPGLFRVTQAGCVTCRGTLTFRWYDANREPADYQCDCINQQVAYRYFLSSNVGLLYQRYGWADASAVNPDALAFAWDYAANAENYVQAGLGIIFHSPDRGTGKSLLAALLLKTLLAMGLTGHYITFADLLAAEMSGYRDDENRSWFLRKIRNAGVLVVDDIGRESRGLTATVAETTFDSVIRHRVANCMPTIITTNLKMDEIRSGYGGNVMSLLSGSVMDQEVPGHDFRAQDRTLRLAEVKAGLTRPIVIQ